MHMDTVCSNLILSFVLFHHYRAPAKKFLNFISSQKENSLKTL